MHPVGGAGASRILGGNLGRIADSVDEVLEMSHAFFGFRLQQHMRAVDRNPRNRLAPSFDFESRAARHNAVATCRDVANWYVNVQNQGPKPAKLGSDPTRIFRD